VGRLGAPLRLTAGSVRACRSCLGTIQRGGMGRLYIALFGITVETGIVMVVYLHDALNRRLPTGTPLKQEDIEAAVIRGAVHRLRPKLMTVCVVLASYVLPRLIDLAMRNKDTTRLRAEVVPHAHGRVLEIGIGDLGDTKHDLAVFCCRTTGRHPMNPWQLRGDVLPGLGLSL
jgi:hypothetical protein